jgi:capsular polysaccharide biosynthesis protein
VLHPKQARALSIRPCTTPSPGNRVWLSRRGLPAELGRVEPEHEIEAVLASRGWTIIRPEDLPVAEQIDLFATAAVVAGCIGSAFHAVLLCAEPRAMLIMITRPWVPMEYFDAIAAARDLRQVYITPSLKPFDLINQQLVVEAVDPMALADAVCDAAGPS